MHAALQLQLASTHKQLSHVQDEHLSEPSLSSEPHEEIVYARYYIYMRIVFLGTLAARTLHSMCRPKALDFRSKGLAVIVMSGHGVPPYFEVIAGASISVPLCLQA